METNEEKILKAIEKDIEEQSLMVIAVVNSEIETMHERQINIYLSGLRNETETYLERELSEMKLFATTRASQDRLKKRRDLLSMRTEMTTSLLDDVRNSLDEFVKSPKYEVFMDHQLDQVTIRNGYFEVRKEDLDMMKEILKKRNLTNEVRVKYFEIGGFTYVDLEEKEEFSCDLTDRLNEARVYFRGHSGFTLVEEGAVNE